LKTFNIPEFYRSSIISKVKELRKVKDPRKKELQPAVLDFGPVSFLIPRHFGFCYGVENAIEISFRAIEENAGKNIFLLSQMIHNPAVNADLESRGVKFLQDTYGKQLISFDALQKEDIVIIPAFGTTLETEKFLNAKGVEIKKYNTTCPFVERVWNRSEKLGAENFTIIIHGKYKHEETRATFSRSEQHAKSVVVKDMGEAKLLGEYVLGKKNAEEFKKDFAGKFSEGFDAATDLDRVGVINQTTMLATETAEIAEYFKNLMHQKFGEEKSKEHFADTRDTLCYATNENQDATLALLNAEADLALVVGGYNSSNTSHLVELLERKFPVYFISSADEIESANKINHFDYPNQKKISTENFLPAKEKVKIILSSGASCPDSIVENVLKKILSFYPQAKNAEEVMRVFGGMVE
jgi:4-hydroxy-3-methylbut-2-enyl diphosphate reductase